MCFYSSTLTPCRYWFGFKIVGDNIDKNVCPQHQTIDTRTQLLHYFRAFAVLDRIYLSSQSEVRPDVNPHEFDLQTLLPTSEDIQKLKSNFQVYISRIITEYFKSMKPLSVVVPLHIEHAHSIEMREMVNVFSCVEVFATDF